MIIGPQNFDLTCERLHDLYYVVRVSESEAPLVATLEDPLDLFSFSSRSYQELASFRSLSEI